MKRVGFSKIFEYLSVSLVSPISCNSCNKIYIDEEEDKDQRKSLLKSHWDQMLDHRDAFGGEKVLALHPEPQTVELRVSMHCIGCARKVEKHISKMEGVTSFEVDLEKKKVIVTGEITPEEVLESISKVMKFAELLVASKPAMNEVTVTDVNHQLISLSTKAKARVGVCIHGCLMVLTEVAKQSCISRCKDANIGCYKPGKGRGSTLESIL